MRRSAFAAKGLRGAGFPPAKPTLTHSAYGQFTISDFNPLYTYGLTVTAGTATRSNAVITLSAVDATLTVTPSFGPTGTSVTAQRKAYTYHTENQQTCSPNCRAISGNCYSDPNPCQGDGSCAADGTICCGGSAGSTCTGNPNAIVKDSTPSGFTDSNSEWWKIT